MWKTFDSTAMPTNILIDKGGKVVNIVSGCAKDGAKAQVHPIEVEERLALLDVPKKLVLLSIARKSRKKAYITMGDAEQAYALVCEEYGEKPRAHTQFWKYVKELDALGLVDTKLSGKGEVGKTTLISLPEIPARVLADNLERSLKRR